MLKQDAPMRRCRWNAALLAIVLTATCSITSAEEPSDNKPTYPLWDGSESVADYAKRVTLPATKTLDLGNGVSMELVLIPPGRFVMGTAEPTPVDEDGFYKKIVTGQALLVVSGVALLVMLAVVILRAVRKRQRPKLSLARLLAITVAAGGALLSGVHWRQSARGLEAARLVFTMALVRSANDNEKPAHPVMLTKRFYVGKFPVTQEQYQQVIGANPSNFIGKDNPVEQVSWDDAQAFCKKLAAQTKQAVRLPTEAEWEYACRAGTTTMYYSGDMEADLGRVAWYSANSKSGTHPVGQKEPNAFGLYDMHGNVWQWCQDWYAEDYYGKSLATDPEGPVQGTFRVLRGGSWDYSSMDCRSAFRRWYNPDRRKYYIGFRVVAVPAFRTPF